VILEYVSFSLTPAVRSGAISSSSRSSEREFLDFVVDGSPLHPLLRRDVVSVLATDLPAAIVATEVSRLLLDSPSEFADGRRLLYSCPECGDLGCGGVTAEIIIDNTNVTWQDFGWQTNYDPEVHRDWFGKFGPYRFELPEYRAALHRVASTID
jgi:hypothetical protein